MPCGDEHHMGARAMHPQSDRALPRRSAPCLRTAPCAKTGFAELQDIFRRRPRKRLVIGVGTDELDSLHSARNHVLNRVAPAPPTPTTLMIVPRVSVSRISKLMLPPALLSK
jgi:hypothetical protein